MIPRPPYDVNVTGLPPPSKPGIYRQMAGGHLVIGQTDTYTVKANTIWTNVDIYAIMAFGGTSGAFVLYAWITPENGGSVGGLAVHGVAATNPADKISKHAHFGTEVQEYRSVNQLAGTQVDDECPLPQKTLFGGQSLQLLLSGGGTDAADYIIYYQETYLKG